VNNIRSLLLLTVVGLIAGFVQVVYAAEYGVINGATVTWAPQNSYSSVANYDQVIRIDDGTVDAQGTKVIIPGMYVAVMPLGSPIPGVQPSTPGSISAVFETTPAGAPTSLQPSTSYYVYAALAVPQGISFWNYVISAVPPWADGYPSDTVYYQMNAGGPPTGGGTPPQIYAESSANSSLVYLGSFITGANGRMVGFNRMGEQVVFATKISGATPYPSYPAEIADQQFVQNVTFPSPPHGCIGANCGYPHNVQATFPGGVVPATATALIADILPPSGTTASSELYLLDPLANAISGVWDSSNIIMTCTATIVQPLTSLTGLERVIAPIAQKAPTLNFGACAIPSWGTQGLTVVYQGYVEPTHHLTFVRP
jgi:hypothetical protein